MRREPLPWFPLAAGLPLMLGLAIAWSAGLGLVFQTLMDAVATFTGDDDAAMFYQRVAVWQEVGVDPVRLVLLVPVHVIALGATWPITRRLAALVRWSTTKLARVFDGWRRLQITLAACAWLLSLGVATAFVIQPGLVPLDVRGPTWLTRTANLLDGTASLETWALAKNLYRRLEATPIPGRYSLQEAQLADHGLDSPLMSRWDPLLRAHTTSREHYAQTKAFMLVESHGRQYAVSSTGCLRLFQFCVSTAQRRPLRELFGTGAVSACSCGGQPCSVPAELRQQLETDGLALQRTTARFPCSDTDARFDPERAIPAGAAFVTELASDTNGNLLLMYIGYNSGPAVAKKLVRVAGSEVTLEGLRPHLATVLERWYGERAASRANGLLQVHLPKLQAAYEHYLRE